jgi:SAM-dependent methyltransferase
VSAAALDLRRLGPPGALILDIGAAAGPNSRDLVRAGFRAVAVEIEAGLAARCASTGVPTIQGDGRTLPLRTAVADGAVIIEVLEHIDGTRAVLAEVARVVKPGGVLCVAVPTHYTEAVYSHIHPRYLANAGHVRRFTRRQLVEVIDDAGFEVQGVTTANLLPAVTWVVHAALRSDADHTGALQEHTIVDRVLARAHHDLVAHRAGARAWAAVERRVGKSWYAYARRAG